jgi:hypothetical protein
MFSPQTVDYFSIRRKKKWVKKIPNHVREVDFRKNDIFVDPKNRAKKKMRSRKKHLLFRITLSIRREKKMIFFPGPNFEASLARFCNGQSQKRQNHQNEFRHPLCGGRKRSRARCYHHGGVRAVTGGSLRDRADEPRMLFDTRGTPNGFEKRVLR